MFRCYVLTALTWWQITDCIANSLQFTVLSCSFVLFDHLLACWKEKTSCSTCACCSALEPLYPAVVAHAACLVIRLERGLLRPPHMLLQLSYLGLGASHFSDAIAQVNVYRTQEGTKWPLHRSLLCHLLFFLNRCITHMLDLSVLSRKTCGCHLGRA